MRGVTVHGHVAPGFERVAEAFERNVVERGELGAAFAAVRDGRMVVDLWGGLADRASGRPWREDTLQLVFSGTKGLVATCLLLLIERGELELEAPVCSYWPEFAAAGKADITVREVVAHTAGLPGIRTSLVSADLLDDRRMAALLAAQEPYPELRGTLCYHARTWGWLCGELVRRAAGCSVGAFFAREVARPLGLELWIGLPAELEPRVSTLELPPGYGGRSPALARRRADPVRVAIYDNPPGVWTRASFPWNDAAFHAAEVPSTNAIGTARSIARLYGCLARGGELDGVRLLAPATVERGRQPLASGEEPFHRVPFAFGIGFGVQRTLGEDFRPLGPPASAFGATGSGGSAHGAWPEQRVGFSYAMNLMRDERLDARPAALLAALHACVV
jgi:CubicO group peptidase (beta-lactamase class C family)